MQVTIMNDSRRKECEAECGVNWSTPEAMALASQRIKDRFGDNIHLAYLDMAKDEANQDVREWNEVIKNRDLLLPLLLVNGQLRISGQFDFRQLMDTIEAEVELGGY